MTVPPQRPTKTKRVDRHLYTWCTKCRQGQGLGYAGTIPIHM
jgi:hypothetical protein